MLWQQDAGTDCKIRFFSETQLICQRFFLTARHQPACPSCPFPVSSLVKEVCTGRTVPEAAPRHRTSATPHVSLRRKQLSSSSPDEATRWSPVPQPPVAPMPSMPAATGCFAPVALIPTEKENPFPDESGPLFVFPHFSACSTVTATRTFGQRFLLDFRDVETGKSISDFITHPAELRINHVLRAGYT